MNKWACGVPQEHCRGSIMIVDYGGRKSMKVHASPHEAFKCMTNYLLEIRGYQRDPYCSRIFHKPGEYALVIQKKSHFGARLRMGKEGTRVQPMRGRGYVI